MPALFFPGRYSFHWAAATWRTPSEFIVLGGGRTTRGSACSRIAHMHSEKPDPPDISGKIPVGLRHSHPGRHNRGDLASAWAFKPNDGG